MSNYSAYQDLRCRRTKTTHQKQADSQSQSLELIERAVGDVAPASTCYCSYWRQTFRACSVKIT